MISWLLRRRRGRPRHALDEEEDDELLDDELPGNPLEDELPGRPLLLELPPVEDIAGVAAGLVADADELGRGVGVAGGGE